MERLRSESRVVEIENSGLFVFIYDEFFRDEIAAADPAILHGFSGGEGDDPALRRLVDRGALVVYELDQDDDLAIELSVGAPLSQEELEGSEGRWIAPQRARINLPTGRLNLQSFDSLNIGEAGIGLRPGAVLELCPGDHLLTVYRRTREEDEDCDEAREVLVLTPAVDRPAAKQPVSLLRFPVKATTPGQEVRALLEDGLFQGRATLGHSDVWLNLSREIAAGLCLNRGARLELVFDGLAEKPWEVLFLDGVRWVLTPRHEDFEELYPESRRRQWRDRARAHGRRFAMAEMSPLGPEEMFVYLDPQPGEGAFSPCKKKELGCRLRVLSESYHPYAMETLEEYMASASIRSPVLAKEVADHIAALERLSRAIRSGARDHRSSARARALVDDAVMGAEALIRALGALERLGAELVAPTSAERVRRFRIFFKRHLSEGAPWVSTFSDLAAEEARLFDKVSSALEAPNDSQR